MSTKKRWRPTKIDELTVKKLEDSFKHWFNITEACSNAGISREAYYKKLNSDPKFLDRMEYSQNFPFFFAKSKIFEAMNSKDIALAAKYALEFLKRRSPERSDKKEPIQENYQPFTHITIRSVETGELIDEIPIQPARQHLNHF